MLISGVVWGLLGAPAAAVPVGEPFQVASGVGAAVTFNPVDRRYLIAHVSPGRGGFAFSPVIGVAAEAAPNVDLVASAAWRAQDVRLAHDPAHNRFLLAYFEVYSGFPPGPPRGLTIVLFEADGTRVAGPTVIAGVGSALAVAYNSRRGEYLVVYEGGGRVGGRRIDADGAPLGAEQVIVDRAQFPAVAYRPGVDDYVLAWTAARPDGRPSVFAARLRPDADSLTDQPREIGGDAGAVWNDAPAIAAQSHGPRVLVTWGSETGVQAQALVGRRLQPARLRTLSATGAQTAIAYNQAAHEYLVMWAAADRERPDAGVRAIYGQHVTRALREIAPNDFRVSVPAFRYGTLPCCPADERWPAVAADTHSTGYLAVWSNEFDPLFNRYRLMARRMTAVR